MNRNYFNLNSTCLSCTKVDHRITECPYVSCFTNFQRYMVIQKYIYSKPQTRCSFLRKPIRVFGFNTLFNKKDVLHGINKISINNTMMTLYSKKISTNLLENNSFMHETLKINTLNTLDEEFEKNITSSIIENDYSHQSIQQKGMVSSKSLKSKSFEDIPFGESALLKPQSPLIKKIESAKIRSQCESKNDKSKNMITFQNRTEEAKTLTLKDEHFALQFEMMKEFKFFNKEGNATQIIKNLNKKNKSALKKKRRKKKDLIFS